MVDILADHVATTQAKFFMDLGIMIQDSEIDGDICHAV